MYTKEVSYGRILQLAFPVIISQLGQITVGLVDNIMIGRLGMMELAASSFVNNIFNLAIFFGTGVTFIITPLIGETIGGKTNKSSSIFKNALGVTTIIGLLITGILLLLSLFFANMGQEVALVGMAKEYFLLLIISYLPLILFSGFKQFAEGTGDTRTGMLIIIAGNIVNIIGNYLFIFGKFGFPTLALNGAAIGTILSRFFMLFAFLWFFGSRKKYARFLPDFKNARIQAAEMLTITKKGTLLGFQILIEASAFCLAGIMIGWMGAPGLAAHQIAISLSSLGFMVYQGMGAATTILISQSYGAGLKDIMKLQAKRATILMVPLSLATALFFVLLRDYLPLIFTSDLEVKKITSMLLIVLAVFQLPDALQIIYASAVRAMADVKMPLFYMFVSYFIVSLPAGYFLAFKLNFNQVGMWLSFPIGISLAYLFLRFRFKRLLKSVLE